MSDASDSSVDWERFEHLARRIRALSYPADPIIDEDTIDLLCSRYRNRPILPNLRALSWGMVIKAPRAKDIVMLECLGSSPALHWISASDDRAEVLNAFLASCPNIAHLRYSRHFPKPAITRSFVGFKNLHTAHITYIDDDSMRHLGTLPNLRVLRGVMVLSDSFVLPHSSFPVLEELYTADNYAYTDALTPLSLISSKSLAVLCLRISVQLPDNLLEYLEKLCAISAVAQLRKLDFTVDIQFNQYDNEDELFEGVAFGHVLRQLTRLRALRDISFQVEFTTSTVALFAVSDTDMDKISSAWPNLRSLTITWACGTYDWHACGIARPSLSAVIRLAERCRKLETFYIEFESVDLGEMERLEARAADCTEPQRALRRIVVKPCTDHSMTLRLADPVRLATALRKIFHNLTGGLGAPLEGGTAGPLRYRHWEPTSMKTDAFRLLKALEETDLGVNRG